MAGGLLLAAPVTTAKIEQDVHQKGITFYTIRGSDPLPATVGLAVLENVPDERPPGTPHCKNLTCLSSRQERGRR